MQIDSKDDINGGCEVAADSTDTANDAVAVPADIQKISANVTLGSQKIDFARAVQEADLDKIKSAVDSYFNEIAFVDYLITPQDVYDDYVTSGAESGVVPFDVDDAHLEVLRTVSESAEDESHKVVGFSLGGTNVDLVAAEISNKGTIDSKAFDSKKIDGGIYNSADDFWRAVFPENFMEVLNSGVDDNGELFIGATIAQPVEEGYLREGKYKCSELTGGSITIEESLKKFIGNLGIVDEKNYM